MLRAVGIDATYKTFNPALDFQPAVQGGPLMTGNVDLADVAFAPLPEARDHDA